jgi:hypothetical protein
VPTLLRVEDGAETGRILGWQRAEWEQFTGVRGLGAGLPDWRPGCGSLSVAPDRVDALRARYAGGKLKARRVELAALEDETEALFAKGWSDGLPVVPPTEVRVLAMLEGTTRAPQEIVAVVPPDLVECSVEKIAINAVMAGCKPEYLPVVIAAVEAACTEQFNIHGVLATTMPVGPVMVVNGPIRRALGMNSGKNVFGQGNRANSTIGRALQLVIRNVGGGRPGEVDRATFGNPGKLSFCFAEDEEGSPWGPLSADLGAPVGASTVTLFPGEGPRSIVDQLSRDPESLARSFALCLRTVHHPKLVLGFDAILAIGPEHARVFREAGWSKAQLLERLHALCRYEGRELARGAGGIAEGLPLPEPALASEFPKFRPNNGLLMRRRRGALLRSDRRLGERRGGKPAGVAGDPGLASGSGCAAPASRTTFPRSRTPMRRRVVHGIPVQRQDPIPDEAAPELHGRAHLPEREEVLSAARRAPGPLADPAADGGAEGEGQGRGPLEPVPARERARRRPHQPRVRAALRDHGARRLRVGGVQLRGA